MKKIIISVSIFSFASLMIIGCDNKKTEPNSEGINKALVDFNVEVRPETFDLQVELNGIKESVSNPLAEMEVSNFNQTEGTMTWEYEKEKIKVDISQAKDYLDVTLTSTSDEANQFSWPILSGDSYMLPINEGKLIPSNDVLWKEYLTDNEIKGIEGLSMQFLTVNKQAYSLVYMIKNPNNNLITFNTEDEIEISFTHEYPIINEQKEYGFRVYVTEKNPVDVAKVYRQYMIETNQFKTLEEKAKENPNIEKLYGASHVYFWNQLMISEENINWMLLKSQMSSELITWIQNLLITEIEDGKELAQAFDDLKSLDYVDKYTKNRIVKAFSAVLQLKTFYNQELFAKIEPKTMTLLNRGVAQLNSVELITLNKQLLKSELGTAVDPIEQWADANTVQVIEEMSQSGLDKVWLGLDDWRTAFMKPELIDRANELGYLTGTYDSYHSIHKPGEEHWITAAFTDESLYEQATIKNKFGEEIQGFNGVGRKLNPTLALPSVKERVSSIFKTGINFTSWFLDTDGTGEVFDDYSKEHITTEAEDIKARMERMEYLQKEWKLVVGTEGGNDFANQVVAFAHGIETPAFSWMDADMNKNKESEYYVGRYYSPTGGVPEMFSKQIPLKDKYKQLFLDPTYTIPLYKLVYNDSVITTHWWGWGTLKFEDEVENRMLYEILYNVPPLYHIDKMEWEKHKESIVKHSTVFSAFNQAIINKEMTNFKMLSEDRLVQMTQYGNDIKVIANFSTQQTEFEGSIIAPHSALIINGSDKTLYTP